MLTPWPFDSSLKSSSSPDRKSCTTPSEGCGVIGEIRIDTPTSKITLMLAAGTVGRNQGYRIPCPSGRQKKRFTRNSHCNGRGGGGVGRQRIFSKDGGPSLRTLTRSKPENELSGLAVEQMQLDHKSGEAFQGFTNLFLSIPLIKKNVF